MTQPDPELTQLRHDYAALEARFASEVTHLESELVLAVGQRRAEAEAQLRSEAVFGSFDGMTSVTGIVIGLFSKGSAAVTLGALGLTVASSCGMAAGEWLSDCETGGRLARAVVMGMATAVGTIVPVIPFFFLPKGLALVVAGLAAVCLCTLIGRAKRVGWKGYLQTYGIIAIAGGLAALVAWLVPGAGG